VVIASSERESKRAKTTILLVDHHQLLRAGVRRILEICPDFEVIGEASNGNEGVRMALEQQPDVVVMEIGLPTLSGIRATRQLSEQACRSKIILLASEANREHFGAALRAGATGYVAKESSAAELLSAVAAVSSGALYASPEIKDHLVAAILNPFEGSSRKLEILSRREREVLALLVDGCSNREIAARLGISSRTVEIHRARVMEKLEVSSLSELVRLTCASRTDATTREERTNDRGTDDGANQTMPQSVDVEK